MKTTRSQNKLILFLWLVFFTLYSCDNKSNPIAKIDSVEPHNTNFKSDQFVVALGIAQDAGYPQAGCIKACCADIAKGLANPKMVSCLGIIDQSTNQMWMIDATPDFVTQLKNLHSYCPKSPGLSGIFLTHAHMGHYTGLMHLGREAMGTKNQKVYAMPRMVNYLSENGPWSQLVELENISLQKMSDENTISLNDNLSITPFLVPHRDEFSETVGFRIKSSNKSLIFIPDIDKWDQWGKSIIDEISSADYSLLDGTFYKNGELPGRDMSQIPHPFIEESISLFSNLEAKKKETVHFIHLNHTNPLLRDYSSEYKEFIGTGFSISGEGEIWGL